MTDGPIEAGWLTDQLPDPVVVFSPEGIIRWANAAATEQFGWTTDEWVGRPGLLLVHPDDVGLAAEALATVQTKSVGSLVELRVRVAGGGFQLVELRGRAVDHASEGPVLVVVLRDITERRRWEVGAGNPTMVQTLIEYSPVITMLVDGEGRLRSASAALVRQLGHPLEDTAGRLLVELVTPEDRPVVAAALAPVTGRGGSVSVEGRLLDAHGEPVAHQITVVALTDDPVVSGLVVTAQDITALVAARQQLEYLASHDPLTGVLNRAGAVAVIDAALGARHPVGVVFLDLDGFKRINDRFGHRAGDLVLVEVADRIRTVAGDNPVGRLGGDEFVIAVTDDVAAVIGALLDDLGAALNSPIAVAGTAVTVTAAVGAAIAQPGDDPASLLAAADAFMYDAKYRRLTPHDPHDPHPPN